MVGRIALFAALTLVTLIVALPTFAQDESVGPVRRSPLGERLQRFREEIFGEAQQRSVTKTRPRAPRALIRRIPADDGSMVVEQPMESPVMRTPTEASPPVMRENPYVNVPSYLETQGARPAGRASSRTSIHAGESSRRNRSEVVGPQAARPDWSDNEQEPIDGGLPPVDYESEPVEIENHTAPADPYVPRGAMPSTYPRNSGGVVFPAREAARRGEPQEADDSDEMYEPVEEYSEEASEETDGPQLGSLPEDEELASEPELPLEEPDAMNDATEDVPYEPAAGLEEPSEALSDDRETLASPESEPQATNQSNVLFTSESPVLSVKATGPRTVLIGTEAEFVVKVRNSGAAANNVVISIHIPDGAEVAGTQPTSGYAQAGSGEARDTLQWTIDRLEADSAETLTLKLVPRTSSPMDLAVKWTFTPETSQTMVEVREPKLAMTISGSTDVLYGQTKTYKLTISNPGNGDTHNVAVGLVPLGRSGEATANHTLGTLKAGESKTIDIELTARQAGNVSIRAHAFADGGLRAEASQQVRVRRANLNVRVEAPPIKYSGTVGTFRVHVENSGDATADNVQVAAMLPPESKFVAASSGGRHEPQRAQVSWTIGSLQPGGRRSFEMQCALAAPGENQLQFSALADGDLSAVATTNTRVEAIADLKLEVRDPQGPVAVGDEAVYEVRIHNRGTKAAQGVELAVFFSEGLEAAAADGGAHDIGTGQVIFRPLDILGPGDSAVYQVRARADRPGNHVFRAEVNCPSLDVKLATEEATHFYGDRRAEADPAADPYSSEPAREPTLATPPEELPTPATVDTGY